MADRSNLYGRTQYYLWLGTQTKQQYSRLQGDGDGDLRQLGCCPLGHCESDWGKKHGWPIDGHWRLWQGGEVTASSTIILTDLLHDEEKHSSSE